jgi:hypothetical protein
VEFFAENVNDGYEGTEVDGHLHGQRIEKTQMTIVLAEEDEHRLIEIVNVAVVGLIG